MSELVPADGRPLVPIMTPEQMSELEVLIRDLGRPEPEHETEHMFVAGLALRRLYVPAGTLVVGRRHKVQNVIMLIRGAGTIWADERVWHLTAPHTLVGPAGARRVLFAHTDVEVVNIYATQAKTPDDLEQEVVES